MNDGVAAEGIVLGRELLEDLENMPYGHRSRICLRPGDHSSKGPSFGEPPHSDHLMVLVVGDKNSTMFRSIPEVDLIRCPFWKNIHGADKIPPSIDQSMDHGPANVCVRVEREAAGQS